MSARRTEFRKCHASSSIGRSSHQVGQVSLIGSMSTAIIVVAYLRRSGTRIAQGASPLGHPTTHSVASSFTAISYGKPIATILQLQLLETERGESNAPEHSVARFVDGQGSANEKSHTSDKNVWLSNYRERTHGISLVAADLVHRRRESSRAGKDYKPCLKILACESRNCRSTICSR